MYTEFYNLKEKPFELTPSPRYLYLGEVHKEALAFLTYGVVERKGFILLTGEVGTGKTTMVQALLASLDKDVECVYVSNPLLSSQDFFDYLAFSAFKKKVRFKSKADFLVEFEEFLKKSLRDQKTFLLIIDEAQRLSFELMEEIRLLSNMETADEKLINIFLVGQPELNDKLAEPRCRALLQRISVRHHIKPLDLDQTREYIEARMKTAGCENPSKIFPKATIKAIYHYSEGYPRMINILGDNALLLGYSREKHKITASMIEECYEEIRFTPPGSEKAPSAPQQETKQEVISRPGKGRLKWAALLFLIALFTLGAALIHTGRMENIRRYLNEKFTASSSKAEISERTVSSTEPPSSPIRIVKELKEAESNPVVGIVEKALPKPPSGAPVSEEAIESSGPPTEPPLQEQAEGEQELTQEAVTVTVKEGDTLAQLATDVYGRADQKLLEFIKRHNPDIRDVNWINVGQKIVFPPLSQDQDAPIYTVHIASYGPFSSAREKFVHLVSKGYEAYIIPVHVPGKGRVYRVAVGNFTQFEKAKEYASRLIASGLTTYAEPIQLEVK